jgi:hypothetical protein
MCRPVMRQKSKNTILPENCCMTARDESGGTQQHERIRVGPGYDGGSGSPAIRQMRGVARGRGAEDEEDGPFHG